MLVLVGDDVEEESVVEVDGGRVMVVIPPLGVASDSDVSSERDVLVVAVGVGVGAAVASGVHHTWGAGGSSVGVHWAHWGCARIVGVRRRVRRRWVGCILWCGVLVW